MRDLTRSLTLILFLMVLFAGMWAAGCGRPAEVAEESGPDPLRVEPASLPTRSAPPIRSLEVAGVEPAAVPGPRPFDGSDHGREARLAFERGDLAAAIAHFDAGLGEDESRSSDRYLLGLALLREGEAERAVTELSRVVMEQPDSWKPRTNLARALLAAGEAEAAREAAREAVELVPEKADAHQVLGRTLLEAKLFEDAEDAFRQALARDPAHAWAWNNLGYTLIQLGRYEDAVAPLGEAVALRPQLARAHNNLGVALERSGDLSGAREAYLAAVELGDDTRAAVSLARVQALLPVQPAGTSPAVGPDGEAALASGAEAGSGSEAGVEDGREAADDLTPERG
jgi:Flp pilus assembly protein TadD